MLRKILALSFGLGLAGSGFGKAHITQLGNIPKGSSEVTPMIGSGYFDFEMGAKFGWRVSDEGFLPMLNDSINAEGSVFLCDVFGSTFMTAAPLMRWNFHVHERWTVYPEAGIELQIPLEDDANGDRRRMSASVNLVIGGLWHYEEGMDLRGEIDLDHSALRIGWAFKFD
jgi:hypothetical protein